MAASSVKKAIKRAEQSVEMWTLVPKFDLGGRAKFDLFPDGTPLNVQQGDVHRGSLIWVPEDMQTEVCLVGGKSYRSGEGPKWRKSNGGLFGGNVNTKVIWFYFKARKKELEVMVQSCARFKIHYGRPVVAADLEPDALAQALGGFFEISGQNLPSGSAGDARLQGAPGISGYDAKPPASEGYSNVATIAGVSAVAAPARVQHGQPVELILRYDVLGPSSEAVNVSQSWTLLLDGQPLPTYPTRRDISRSRGSYEAALQQVIPVNAPAGVYKFKGEVCVGEDCGTRTTTFEVLP